MFKYTIVTPTFNQAKYLPMTLDSVLLQANPDNYKLEYLVFNACSTDDTENILKEYQKKFADVDIDYKFFTEPDEGQSDAINKGFTRATGDVISYINSDDTYTPNALRDVYQFFSKQPNALWAYGGWNIITEHGAVFDGHKAEPYSKRRLLSYCYIGQPSCFYRKVLLEKAGYVNKQLHLAMDYDLWLRFAEVSSPGVINAVLSNMRFYENTKSAIYLKKQLDIALLLSKKYSKPWSIERLLQYYYYLRSYLSSALHHDISRQVARFNRKQS